MLLTSFATQIQQRVAIPGFCVANPGFCVAKPGFCVAKPGFCVAKPGFCVANSDVIPGKLCSVLVSTSNVLFFCTLFFGAA